MLSTWPNETWRREGEKKAFLGKSKEDRVRVENICSGLVATKMNRTRYNTSRKMIEVY
jgi:hypothetical protein